MYSTLLSEWTTIGIGGAARRLDVADSRDMFIELAPFGLVLGGGSNVLVSDDGYDGNVVINKYREISILGDTVTVGSGAKLPAVARYLADVGLTGLEWASGIPGSVGGAVRMNAGAFGGCIADVIVCAEVLRDGRLIVLDGSALGLDYRESRLLESDKVVSATFKLQTGDPRAIADTMRRYACIRRSSQPAGKSAGSVFKNPRGVSVGKLLDDAGLKGTRIGGAMISPIHANIIVNTGGATARDVTELISVMRRVLEDNDIKAREEIKYIGGFQ